MANLIGSFRVVIEFSGDSAGWNTPELQQIAQAAYDAMVNDAGVSAALAGANGNYTLPRLVFVPGFDGTNASHLGGNPSSISVS